MYCESVQLSIGGGLAGRKVLWIATALIALPLACLGCRESPNRTMGPRAEEATTSSPTPLSDARRRAIEQALGVDAGDFSAIVDPPAPAGDLRADIEGFTSLDACVERRRALDPLLGDALEAVGYDTFLRDACRVLDAAKTRDRKRCAAITASPLRLRCEATVAEVTANADACPWDVGGKPDRGRDPMCLAIASRDARLCVSAEDPFERATCSSIARGDDKACAALTSPLDRARCSRDALRWRSTATANAASTDALVTIGRLRVAPPKALGIPPLDEDMTVDISRGVVLREGFSGARIDIGSFDADSGFIASSPQAEVRLSLEIRIAAGGASVDRAELAVPSRPVLTSPPVGATLRVSVEKPGRARADTLWISVDGDVGDAGAAWHVHASLRTFVRDVVRPEDADRGARAIGTPELGQDLQLR